MNAHEARTLSGQAAKTLPPIPILAHEEVPPGSFYVFPSGARLEGAKFSRWLFEPDGWPKTFALFPRWDAFWARFKR